MPPTPPAAGSDAPPPPAAAKKERHVVTWTSQEDDLLRDQVAMQGVDNWAGIAGRFKDKTGRQCRRRWYTYLNAECKKGGWSPEEDMLLCEAQKIFGNKWTEIAKVVSGRTDNAVKNRFSTLSKKRAKDEGSSKENCCPFGYRKNKRVLTQNVQIMNGISEASTPTMHARYGTSDLSQSRSMNESLLRPPIEKEEQSRPPLAVLVQNFHSSGGLPTQVPLSNSTKATIHSALSNKIRGAFFNQDDPKVSALLQQADLLSSLAVKVNTENTSQSLENAWKELQDYLVQTEEIGPLRRKLSGMDSILDDFKDLVEDLKSTDLERHLPLREPELHEDSQGSSEYSTGSTDTSTSQESRNKTSQESKNIQQEADELSLNHKIEASVTNENAFCQSINSARLTSCSENVQQKAEEYLLNNTEISSRHGSWFCSSINSRATALHSSEEPDGNGNISILPNPEFSSPLHTKPVFTQGLPSPQFSASERQILLSMFGLSSPVSSSNSVQVPSCKKALLDSLSPS